MGTFIAGRAGFSADTALRAAIETDRRYFELGAIVERLAGAELAWMPGLTGSPSGIVVHRVAPSIMAARGPSALRDLERRLVALGSPLARIYLDEMATVVDEILASAGYTRRTELAFVGDDVPDPQGESILCRVIGNDGWARKARFHEEAADRPDGHPSTAAEWVAMERAKCETGVMEPYVLEIDGDVVGTACALRHGEMLRMKNLVSHPSWRRRGVGHALIRHFAAIARHERLWGVGVLAVGGEPGEKLYRSSGLRAVGAQVEWSKALVA